MDVLCDEMVIDSSLFLKAKIVSAKNFIFTPLYCVLKYEIFSIKCKAIQHFSLFDKVLNLSNALKAALFISSIYK
jgi:hypothetical protein